MDRLRAFLLIAQVASGLLLIGLSVPLFRRLVPPNHWYGFRVPKTLADPATWYEANARSGGCFLRAGVAILILGSTLCAIPALDGPARAMACAGLDLAAVGWATIASFRHLGRIAGPAGS